MSILTIPQGTTWAAQWPVEDSEGVPVDVTGWTVRAQVRATIMSDFVLHEWSTTAGNAEAGSGVVAIRVTPNESYVWAWRHGYFDVMLTSPDGERIKLDGGTIMVDAAVTRENPAV